MRTKPIIVKPGCHPIVHAVAGHVTANRLPLATLADRVGIRRERLHDWFRGKYWPNLRSVEAVANELRHTLRLVPDDETTKMEHAAAYLQEMGWTVIPPRLDARAATQKPVGGV